MMLCELTSGSVFRHLGICACMSEGYMTTTCVQRLLNALSLPNNSWKQGGIDSLKKICFFL